MTPAHTVDNRWALLRNPAVITIVSVLTGATLVLVLIGKLGISVAGVSTTPPTGIGATVAAPAFDQDAIIQKAAQEAARQTVAQMQPQMNDLANRLGRIESALITRGVK